MFLSLARTISVQRHVLPAVEKLEELLIKVVVSNRHSRWCANDLPEPELTADARLGKSFWDLGPSIECVSNVSMTWSHSYLRGSRYSKPKVAAPVDPATLSSKIQGCKS